MANATNGGGSSNNDDDYDDYDDDDGDDDDDQAAPADKWMNGILFHWDPFFGWTSGHHLHRNCNCNVNGNSLCIPRVRARQRLAEDCCLSFHNLSLRAIHAHSIQFNFLVYPSRSFSLSPPHHTHPRLHNLAVADTVCVHVYVLVGSKAPSLTF